MTPDRRKRMIELSQARAKIRREILSLQRELDPIEKELRPLLKEDTEQRVREVREMKKAQPGRIKI